MTTFSQTVELSVSGDSVRAELLYLGKYEDPARDARSPLAYIQLARRLDSDTRRQWEGLSPLKEAAYRAERNGYVARFRDGLCGREIGRIAAAPSSRRLVQPYQVAAADALPEALDVSEGFRKDGTAALAKSASAVLEMMSYNGPQVPPEVDRVLLVDDSFASGRTAGAMVARLREAGLRRQADVIVACPLLVRGSA